MYKLKIKKIVTPGEGSTYTVAGDNASHIFLSDGRVCFFETEYTSELEAAVELEAEETEMVEEGVTAEVLRDRERHKIEEQLKFEEEIKIRPGVWSLGEEKLQQIEWPEELYFDTETSLQLKKEIDAFFSKSDLIKKFKKPKRSYLLHSIPGVGKTALMRSVCRNYDDGSTAFIRISGNADFQKLAFMFSQEYDPAVKKVILLVEDIGGKAHGDMQMSFNPSCLNFLDGDIHLFKVPTLVVCTTNFIKDIGTTLVNRPGRFSKVLKVHPPKIDEVFDIVQLYSGVELTDEHKEAFKEWEGKVTPDHCIEAVIRSEVEEIDLSKSLSDIMQERSRYINTSDWE